MLRPNRILVFLIVCGFLTFAAGAQNQASPQTSSAAAQGLALAQRALAAMTKGIGVIDVTLVGTAERIAGSDDETGPITLKAKGTTESTCRPLSGDLDKACGRLHNAAASHR